MKRISVLIAPAVMLWFILACGVPPSLPIPFAPTENVQEECIPAEPTEQDIRDILSYYKKTFGLPGWERSYMVMPNRVAVTWLHNESGGLAYSENLLYNCGGAYELMDEYFSKESFEIIFADYDSYNETAYCQSSDLRLYQFDVINQNLAYQVRYWADPQSDTRVYITMLVFPDGSLRMDEYAKSLYPHLARCK